MPFLSNVPCVTREISEETSIRFPKRALNNTATVQISGQNDPSLGLEASLGLKWEGSLGFPLNAGLQSILGNFGKAPHLWGFN